jgi:nucleotide-binding universal stress UspA family protein
MSVVLAYVPTPEGDAALDAAVEEAERRGSAVVVVNVTRPADQDDTPFTEEQVLDAVQARFRAAGVQSDVRQLPSGTDIADAVIEVAEETAAELVVIGLRRRTALGKLIMGSTAQRLLLGLECPVLAVKAPR